MVLNIHRFKYRIAITMVVLVLVTVLPVSAVYVNGYYQVAPNVSQSATVFIGEQGLNITPAITTARGANPATWNTIGWWVSSANPGSTPPTVSVNTAGRASSFTVTQAEFDTYTGQWYLVNETTSYAVAPVFNVKVPYLIVTIRDPYQNDGADVSGTSVPTGSRLQFQVVTNMYTVLDPTLRSTVYNQAGGTGDSDGYLDIVVKNESGTILTTLYNTTGPANTIKALNVSTQPFTWGRNYAGRGSGIDYVWDTGALVNGEKAYPAGIYNISVVSKLNNMNTNYLSGGAAYTGRTVSEVKTITLVSDPVSITANMDSVVLTKPFSVTITGKPSTWYNVWVKSTYGLVLNDYDNAPPIVTWFQDYVYQGNSTTFNYLYQNGGGVDTVGMNAFGTPTGSDGNPTGPGDYSYAYVKTSTSGTRTVEFTTTHNTKAQKYTVRVEKNFVGDGQGNTKAQYDAADFKGDEVDVIVGIPTTKIGVTNGVDWYLEMNGNGVWDGTGPGNDKYAYFGIPGYTPVVGDWNGDNKTEIGYTNGVSWYLDDNGNGVWDGTAPGKDKYGYFGITGYTPVVGDWNGDMKTEIGVTNSVNWYLDNNGNGVWDGTGPGNDKYAYFGITGWTPLVGKW